MSGKPVKVRGRKNPIDILFNLDHPEGPPVDFTEIVSDAEPVRSDEDDVDDDTDLEDEEEEPGLRRDIEGVINRRTFVVASKSLAARPNWVSVTNVFGGASDSEIMKRAGVAGFDDPRHDRYAERLKRLRDIQKYMYVMHVLHRELSYEEVAEIFVRVNSLGVKLRSSDLALAQITAKGRNFLDAVEEFQESCERSWFTLDTGLVVRTLIVFATGQAKFKSVGQVPLKTLNESWEKAKRGLEFAVNFLRSNCDIEDETLLSAPTLIVPVAVLSHERKQRLTQKDERDLAYWLHVANLRGRYSRGSSETLLNEDIQILQRGGSPEDLLEPIRRIFGRLDVQASDLVGRPARSPLFPLTYLASRAAGATDWRTPLKIQLASVGKQHEIEYHHIFPKAMLKAARIDGPEVNEIANLAFITAATNKWIGKRRPDQYLPEVVRDRGDEVLKKQFIPTDPALWSVDKFGEFLAERRRLLADAVNAHIERAKAGA